MKPFALMATELYNNLFDGVLGAESITGTMTMIILNFIFFPGVYGKFVAVTCVFWVFIWIFYFSDPCGCWCVFI